MYMVRYINTLASKIYFEVVWSDFKDNQENKETLKEND